MPGFPVPAIALAALSLCTAVASASAQQLPPPGTPPEQIRQQIDAMGLRGQLLERIRSSGMTPEQVRQELARRGYDPSLLDAYMDQTVTAPPEPNATVLSAVEALGVLQPQIPDSLLMAVPADRAMPDSSAIERERGLRVFGLEVFSRGTTEFEPITTGAVPQSYVVGPGDELVLFLTGDVERTYQLPVTREGFIVIPQVGQVWVNGLTLEQVRDRLYTHLGRAYSGVRRGPEATTQFQVSLGRLRPNQVYVSGRVMQPGSYLVSSVASALNALYQAGGPTPTGSFRDVRLLRGGDLVERLDLYAYLLQGDNLNDVRLEPGDVLFIPTHLAQVSIEGVVPNPAIYEMRPGETLADLVAFAGGLDAPAHLRRARITRILPPEERIAAGVDRTVVDVSLADVLRDPESAPALAPGDAVEIFPIVAEVRNVVTAQGGVWHPGTFQYTPGMRLWDLIRMADGLADDAYRGRAQIVRLDRQDSTLSIVPVSLETGADGAPVDNPELREFDVLRVVEESAFTTTFPVTITGEVREAVRDTFFEGMTLRDLIIRAGGLEPTADLTVHVARLPDPTSRSADQTAEIVEVQLDSSYFVSSQDQRLYLGDLPPGDAAAGFQLRPYDRVLVRRLPDIELDRAAKVTGEVRYPGTYTLQRKDERLSSVLGRAGGLSTTAFAGGARFFRSGTLVNVNLPEAMENRGSRHDLVLLPGDSLFVPEYDPVVLVRGAVNAPGGEVAVLFQEGAGLEYYIEQAGGYSRFADRDNVNIRYANGSGATVDRFLVFSRRPEPGPGSTVTIPALRDEDRTNWPGLISDLAQVAAALTTVLVVISRL